MKVIFSLMVLTFSLQTWAAEITCDPNKKTSKFAVKAELGETIVVAGLESGGSAYIWHSVEKLPWQLEIGAKIGSINTRNFSVDADNQVEKSKLYTFRLAQAWTPDGAALATCKVVVKK